MTATIDSPLAVVERVLGDLAGKRILDLGCGGGGLAKDLVARGAEVTGADPNAEALLSARRSVENAAFIEASAEALPFEDGSFDAVVTVNTLHHVPMPSMGDALGEMARVLRAGGRLMVIEPLAEGSFFEALRLVEDETVVRLEAQRALALAVERGLLERERTVSYVRREIFADVDGFLARIVAVDPARAPVVQANLAAITAAVLAAAVRDPQGKLVLDQPIRADVLRLAGR